MRCVPVKAKVKVEDCLTISPRNLTYLLYSLQLVLAEQRTQQVSTAPKGKNSNRKWNNVKIP